MLAPVTYGMLTSVQEPLAISRRDCMGRHLNGGKKNVSSGQRTLASPLRKLATYERDVSEGVPATVIS